MATLLQNYSIERQDFGYIINTLHHYGPYYSAYENSTSVAPIKSEVFSHAPRVTLRLVLRAR